MQSRIFYSGNLEEVVQEEPAKILDSDSGTKLTQSNYQQETPPDLVLFSMIFIILVL